MKSFRNAAESGEQGDGVQKLFVAAQKALSKAATKGIIHENNASRKVARLSAVLTKAQNGVFKKTETKKK